MSDAATPPCRAPARARRRGCSSIRLMLLLVAGDPAARPGDGDLGVDLHRRARERRSVRLPRAPAAAGAAAACALAALLFAMPDRAAASSCALPLLVIAGVLLLLVLIPGLGPRGQRQPPLAARWPGFNFQVSEAGARAGADLGRQLLRAPREASCAAASAAWCKPLGLLAVRRGAAAGRAGLRRRHRCCSSPASACCSSAGAQPALGAARCVLGAGGADGAAGDVAPATACGA